MRAQATGANEHRLPNADLVSAKANAHRAIHSILWILVLHRSRGGPLGEAKFVAYAAAAASVSTALPIPPVTWDYDIDRESYRPHTNLMSKPIIRRIPLFVGIMLLGFCVRSTSAHANAPVKSIHNTNRADISREQMACIEKKMEELGYCEGCQLLGNNSLVCSYSEARYHGRETLSSRVGNEFAAAMNACAPAASRPPKPVPAVTVDCVARTPLSDLGYLSGHKTRYCFSEGYDSYDPVHNVCTRNCAVNGDEIRLPLNKTDYLSGHKTRYCRAAGYAGYRPASGGDKYPIVGYCYKLRR